MLSTRRTIGVKIEQIDDDLSACSHSGSKTPLQSFLGIAEQHTAQNGVRVSTVPVQHIGTHRPHRLPPLTVSLCFSQSNVSLCASPHNPTAITSDEYFNPEFNLNGRDIGRPVELTSKVQRYGGGGGTQMCVTKSMAVWTFSHRIIKLWQHWCYKWHRTFYKTRRVSAQYLSSSWFDLKCYIPVWGAPVSAWSRNRLFQFQTAASDNVLMYSIFRLGASGGMCPNTDHLCNLKWPEHGTLSASSPGLKLLCGWVSLTLCPWPSRWRPSSTSWPSLMLTSPSCVIS